MKKDLCIIRRIGIGASASGVIVKVCHVGSNTIGRCCVIHILKNIQFPKNSAKGGQFIGRTVETRRCGVSFIGTVAVNIVVGTSRVGIKVGGRANAQAVTGYNTGIPNGLLPAVNIPNLVVSHPSIGIILDERLINSFVNCLYHTIVIHNVPNLVLFTILSINTENFGFQTGLLGLFQEFKT